MPRYKRDRKTAKITLIGNKVTVNTPYSEQFVMDLKALVPYDKRKWNGGLKVWEISDANFFEPVKKLAKKYFDLEDVSPEARKREILRTLAELEAQMVALEDELAELET